MAKAVKPLPPAFLMALRKIDAKRATTVVIGDQLVTDVLGAHFLGMTRTCSNRWSSMICPIR